MVPLTRMLGMLAALLAGACTGPDAMLALDGEGGDAWTFGKRVEGRVIEGACDEIVVTSPGGTVPAWRDGARFAAKAALHNGPNEVRALCRSNGEEHGASAAQRWTVRIDDVPKAWVRIAVEESGLMLDAGRSEPAPARPARIVRYEWRARPGNPAPLHAVGSTVPLDAASAAGEELALRTPDADGEYYLTLRVIDALGRDDESTAMFRVNGGKPLTVDLAREHPAWVDDAVVYGVVPFFFGRRGLDDVTARLDEIAEIGANVLWLSPITEAPEDDFGYAVTDHFGLRDAFGTEADLRELVDAAHARGIRIIMDFVPNHAAEQHPYYADVARHGPASAYFDFFDRGAAGEVTHYFDWENLKNLNFDNPEVQRYIIEAFAHWVRDVGIDGFRVDVSWGVQERAPEFWPRWREELKRIDPDLLLLAEASARDPYNFTHGFDAAYDWTGKLGEWAWRDAWEDGVRPAAALRAALGNDGAGLHPDALVFRFLNNNDTGARFITRYGIERTRVASTMLFTLPGIPCIYTGQEVGAAFEPYNEGPPIAWTDPHGLREHYKRLAALRHAQPALRSRDLRLLETSHGDTVLAYLRPAAAARDGLLVLLNYGSAPATVSLPPGGAVRAVVGGGRLLDLLSGETLAIRADAPAVSMPAFGARVLRRAPAPGAGHAD